MEKMSGKTSPSNRVSDIDLVEASLSRKASMVDDFDKDPEKTEPCGTTSVCSTVIKITVVSICGIVFGICVEKARVFEPVVIRQQMVFENFIMLKMFLSAVATGQLCFSFLSVLPKTKPYLESAREDFVNTLKEKGLLTNILGPFILGIGMTMAGTCPGMVLAQIGAWVPNAIFSLLGVFVGALTYGLLEPVISRLTKPKNPYTRTEVDKTVKKPFIAFALPMALLLGIVVFIIEWFWSWKKDLASIQRENPDGVNIATAVAWPPYASGIILGLLQIPLVLVLKDTIGGSSSYVTIVSQWVITDKLSKNFPYLANKRSGVGNWWQVFYVSFAVVGACVSGAASNTLSTGKGVPVHVALIGGFLIIFGARLAAGCTSGHGLSGMALLVWLSFLAVPAMFAGSIVTAFSMQATGALDTYVDYTGGV